MNQLATRFWSLSSFGTGSIPIAALAERRLRSCALTLLIVSCMIPELVAQGTITDLGTLITNTTFVDSSAYLGSYALGINASGQVVGYVYFSTGGGNHPLATRIFLYSGGRIDILPTFFEGNEYGGYGYFEYGNAINASGQIAGSFSPEYGFDSHALLCSGGKQYDLGTLYGADANSNAQGINASGQIVGSSDVAPEVAPSAYHAFLYSDGKMIDLGSLGGRLSAALGINVSGQVVGWSWLADDATTHAFLYSGGKMTDLGTLGGDSYAYAINDSGQVVGESASHAFLYSGGKMYDLGTLDGSAISSAAGINASGQIVGYSFFERTTGSFSHAFLYSGGKMIDLNSQLTANSGWVLTSATAINDSGQIVGYGQINGQDHAFLLSGIGQEITAPDLVWPQNNTTSNGTTFTLQWTPASEVAQYEAVQYQVYLGSSPTALSLYTTVNTPGLTAAARNLNAGTRYYWKVVAISGGGTSATSEVWSFTTPGAPAGPNVIWPLNGGTSDGTSLTLTWTQVTGATQYQVYFGSSSASLSLYATVTAPSVTAALYNLNAGTPYYWRVAAIVSGQPLTSAVWSFTTPGRSHAPLDVWPLNGSTSEGTSLNLQWTPIDGASQYQVYFGSAPASQPLYATVTAPAVRVAVYNLNSGTVYYWKVAVVIAGTSATSGIWSFATPGGSQTLSPPPQVVWPLDGATGEATTLTVQWSPVPGATQYQIYFSDNPNKLALYSTVKSPTVNGAFYHLTRGTTYYWQVVAIAAEKSVNGAVWSFTTQ